jgi:predicted nuclease of predicted toxin-antitoxin system
VKLLFDENLSRHLVRRLSDLFAESQHVATAGLLRATDREIWEYARTGGFTIVTADGDFYELAVTQGSPPKVIWLRGCDYPTREAERLIRDQSVRITEFVEDKDRAVLILRP